MNLITRAGLVCWLCLGFAALSRAGVATFDDLPPSLPPLTTIDSTGLFYANNNSSVYDGVVWDSRVNVVGDDYRIDTTTPGPLYGIPHSGHYFITNQAAQADNDGILLTTNQILLGAWFGQNAYYGFSTGANQVTVVALGGSVDLASETLIFPVPADVSQPGSMIFLDTSSFKNLTGITGYRIDREPTAADFTGNWTADDFTFTSAVPEPSSVCLLGLGLISLGGSARWNKARRRRIV